jgi:hypothetical protein
MFRRNWARSGLKMWIEIIVGYIAFCVIVYFSIRTYEEFNIRKQRRRYKEEDDIGRRQKEEVSEKAERKSRGSPKGIRNSATGKRGIQERVEHAKRELLQGGTSGGNKRSDKSNGRSKQNSPSNSRQTKVIS